VIELASSPENTLDSDYTSDCEDTPVVLCNVKLTAAVRKQLAVSIRDLMQHGLMPVSTGIVLNCALNCTPGQLTVSVMSWTYIAECNVTTQLPLLQTFKQLGRYLNFSACFIEYKYGSYFDMKRWN
jgi:hypothetical protein